MQENRNMFIFNEIEVHNSQHILSHHRYCVTFIFNILKTNQIPLESRWRSPVLWEYVNLNKNIYYYYIYIFFFFLNFNLPHFFLYFLGFNMLRGTTYPYTTMIIVWIIRLFYKRIYEQMNEQTFTHPYRHRLNLSLQNILFHEKK